MYICFDHKLLLSIGLFCQGYPPKTGPSVTFHTEAKDRNIRFYFPPFVLSSKTLFWNWTVIHFLRGHILLSLRPLVFPGSQFTEINKSPMNESVAKHLSFHYLQKFPDFSSSMLRSAFTVSSLSPKLQTPGVSLLMRKRLLSVVVSEVQTG